MNIGRVEGVDVCQSRAHHLWHHWMSSNRDAVGLVQRVAVVQRQMAPWVVRIVDGLDTAVR